MMIDDGYTYRYQGYWYRKLVREDRAIVTSLVKEESWEELDLFLWHPPRFFGGTPNEDDRNFLFARMMSNPDERAETENLKRCVELMLTKPLLAHRSCDLCQRWWFDEDTGAIARNEQGPILRPSHAKVSCETHSGCEKGTHENPIQFTAENKKAWEHYLNFRHSGLTDTERSCPIIQRNWRVIGTLVEKHGIPEVCH